MRYYSSSADFYYETTASTLNYYISVSGETIYSGKAVASPSTGKISVNVGKRVRDYLNISLPSAFWLYEGVIVPHPEALLVFGIYNSDSGALLEQYEVKLDYLKSWDGTFGVMNEPINGHAAMFQKIFITSYNNTGGSGGGSGGGGSEGGGEGGGQGGGGTGSTINVNVVPSNCKWVKVEVTEYLAKRLGLKTSDQYSAENWFKVNYYRWYGGEYYWIVARRRGVAYQKVYPYVYKCVSE